MKKAALRHIKSFDYFLNNLGKDGKLQSYEEKNKESTAEDVFHKQPDLG
jgi:hypothetical protein